MAKPRKPKPEKVGIDSISQTNTKAIALGVVGIIVALALIAVAVTLGNKDDSDDPLATDLVEFRPVTITGAPLPSQYSDPPNNTQLNEAIGAQAPDIIGSDFAGNAVNITKDGRGKAIVFLAHWCPHCQAEAPLLSDWIKDNASKYPNVDFIAVATASTPTRANYPPSKWLDKEDWPAKIIADSNSYEASKAYGLGSYPYMVFLDGQNKVVTRTSGEIAMTDFGNLVQRTADAVNTGQVTTTTAPAGATTTTAAPSSPAAP
jgi:thiol-disulfide isomerase/thioredoxin